MLSLLVVAIAIEARTEKEKTELTSVTGRWECIAHGSPQGDVPFTLTLHQDKETVTGAIATADGELQIKSGSFKNATLEIRCETDQAKYVVTGKLGARQLSGHWSKTVNPGAGDDQGGDQEGEWEGKMPTAAKSSGQ